MRVEKTAEYAAWIDALKDRAGRARILMRVEQQKDIQLAIKLAKNFQE